MDTSPLPTGLAAATGSALSLEDPLTDEVWGALDLLPREMILRPVLEEVGRLNPGCGLAGNRLERLLADVEQFEFAFRPSERTEREIVSVRGPDYATTTVPDVVLESPSWGIVVEAKFGARLGEPIDQLPREFAFAFDLSRSLSGTSRDFLLLAVTPGHTPPRVRAPLPVDVSRRIIEGHERVDAGTAIKGFFDILAERARDERSAGRVSELRDLVETHTAWIGWSHIARVMRSAVAQLGSSDGKDSLASLLSSARRLGQRALGSFEDRGIRPFTGFAAGWEAPDSLRSYKGGRLLLETGGRG